jgi:predicted transport protein
MDKAMQTMIDNMHEKTGKSLEEWKTILQQKSFKKPGEAVKFIQEEYGATYGYATTIVNLYTDGNKSGDELIENQYKGKENLIGIYDHLMSVIRGFGNDITISPKKDSVSIIRKRQFALIKPATKTRIDLGLKIKNKDPEGRLENSGPFGVMCSHRVRLEAIEDIDHDVLAWLREAYEQSV